MKTFPSILAAAMIAAMPVHSAVLNYDEAIDGDLSSSTSNPDFLLDTAGTNTVVGTAGYNLVDGWDADRFRLTLGTNIKLTSASIEIFSYSSSGLITSRLSYSFAPVPFTSPFINTQFDLMTPGPSASAPTTWSGELLSGTFQASQGGSVGGAGSMSGDFRWTFVTENIVASQVPLPTTLPLIASALGLFGLLRFRRRRAS